MGDSIEERVDRFVDLNTQEEPGVGEVIMVTARFREVLYDLVRNVRREALEEAAKVADREHRVCTRQAEQSREAGEGSVRRWAMHQAGAGLATTIARDVRALAAKGGGG